MTTPTTTGRPAQPARPVKALPMIYRVALENPAPYERSDKDYDWTECDLAMPTHSGIGFYAWMLNGKPLALLLTWGDGDGMHMVAGGGGSMADYGEDDEACFAKLRELGVSIAAFDAAFLRCLEDRGAL